VQVKATNVRQTYLVGGRAAKTHPAAISTTACCLASAAGGHACRRQATATEAASRLRAASLPVWNHNKSSEQAQPAPQRAAEAYRQWWLSPRPRQLALNCPINVQDIPRCRK
jgi:hypothetical protein